MPTDIGHSDLSDSDNDISKEDTVWRSNLIASILQATSNAHEGFATVATDVQLSESVVRLMQAHADADTHHIDTRSVGGTCIDYGCDCPFDDCVVSVDPKRVRRHVRTVHALGGSTVRAYKCRAPNCTLRFAKIGVAMAHEHTCTLSMDRWQFRQELG
jgi:hypothetical protein